MAPKKGSRAKLSIKLLVHTKSQLVLYAEAGKDVVDFLFSLLTLPVGTAVKLLGKDAMVGSVGNLYRSVDELDDTYICRDDAKNDLLTPTAGCQGGKLLQLEAAPPESVGMYRCNRNSYSYPNCRNYMTKIHGATCQCCRGKMTTQLVEIVDPTAGGAASSATAAASAGFVQGIMTYTVTDDLKVAPMSSISRITLLNSFGVTDIGSLKEKTVQLGYAEGLEILKASLQSRTVLTDVFLGKRRMA